MTKTEKSVFRIVVELLDGKTVTIDGDYVKHFRFVAFGRGNDISFNVSDGHTIDLYPGYTLNAVIDPGGIEIKEPESE